MGAIAPHPTQEGTEACLACTVSAAQPDATSAGASGGEPSVAQPPRGTRECLPHPPLTCTVLRRVGPQPSEPQDYAVCPNSGLLDPRGQQRS